MKHPPRWVDGSGLSRYNLFTPASMVYVLRRLHREVPEERLFDLFPSGVAEGTLKEWFEPTPLPFIYAKTGSMGNVLCLSGYLQAKSGGLLIFSIMHNNYQVSSTELKAGMAGFLKQVRELY